MLNLVDAEHTQIRHVQDNAPGPTPSKSAGRLATASGAVQYTWDDNGNLLDDGTSTYAYTAANRLKLVTQGTNSYTFAYNGLGDRSQQTVNGQTTNYTLDLAWGLTQVLDDGTHTYLYGNTFLAQIPTTPPVPMSIS